MSDLDLFIGTVAVAPIVVALIQVFKWAGLPTAYAPWLNLFLYLVFVFVAGLVGMYPGLLEPAVFALNIVIGVLTAAGFYNRAKATVSWLRHE